LAERYERLHVCFEAGPTGYGFYRQIQALGHNCMVVAPALIPKRAGERIKTNRRDAVTLARLHRAGELTGVWTPHEAHEAVRDLVRAREAAADDLRRKRQQLLSFLLRHRIKTLANPIAKWATARFRSSCSACSHSAMPSAALGQYVDEPQQRMARGVVRDRRQGSGQLRFGRREGRQAIGHKEMYAFDCVRPRRSNERVDIVGIDGERAVEKAARLPDVVRGSTLVEPSLTLKIEVHRVGGRRLFRAARLSGDELASSA
jgi:transposase